MNEFLTRLNSWPRSMRWVFWASLFTVAFLIWDSTIAELGASWSVDADKIEMQIQEVNTPLLITTSVKNSITSFGEIELPRPKADGASSMTDSVHEILRKHNVKDDEYPRTKTSRMKSSALRGIANPSQQIEQVIGDIRFVATQEEVLRVISDLEGSPWIDAVSDIRLTKKDGRMIRVDLTVEAWVISSSKRGRRG